MTRSPACRRPCQIGCAQALARAPEAGPQLISEAQRANHQQNVNLLGGLFAQADRDGFFEGVPGWSNPFHVGFEISRTERQPYEPFSNQELQRLFASPVFTQGLRPEGGKGEAAYWLPLISLFSGSRRTEIAQLRVEDVRQGEGGIWFFDFNDRGEDQRLKNEFVRPFSADALRADEAGLGGLCR